MTFISGNKPHNKVSSESEDYIKKNYKTMTKPAMGKVLGIHQGSVLRIMNRLGLKRTQEDIMNLMKPKSIEPIKIVTPKVVTVTDRVIESLKQEDKVPVILNEDTTVWVKKSKCRQLKNGSWVKKEPLNIIKNGRVNKKSEDMENITTLPSNYVNGRFLVR